MVIRREALPSAEDPNSALPLMSLLPDDACPSLMDLPEGTLDLIIKELKGTGDMKRMRLVCRQALCLVDSSVKRLLLDDRVIRAVESRLHVRFPNLTTMRIHVTDATPSCTHAHSCVHRQYTMGGGRGSSGSSNSSNGSSCRGEEVGDTVSPQLALIQKMFAVAVEASGGIDVYAATHGRSQGGSRASSSRGSSRGDALRPALDTLQVPREHKCESTSGGKTIKGGNSSSYETSHACSCEDLVDRVGGLESVGGHEQELQPGLASRDPVPELQPGSSPLQTLLANSLEHLQRLTRIEWDCGCRQLSGNEWEALAAGLPGSCVAVALPYHLPPHEGLPCVVQLCPEKPWVRDVTLWGQGNVRSRQAFRDLGSIGPWLAGLRGLGIACPGLGPSLLPTLRGLTQLELSWLADAQEAHMHSQELLDYLGAWGQAEAKQHFGWLHEDQHPPRPSSADDMHLHHTLQHDQCPDQHQDQGQDQLRRYQQQEGQLFPAVLSLPYHPPQAANGLSLLQRLILFSYCGDINTLVQALHVLPHLSHLDVFNYDVRYYFSDDTLDLMAQLPGPLLHLGCNGLDLHHEATCMRHLTSLEVMYSIFSVPRLTYIFPAVTCVQLRWLWSQTMRKLAGWGSVTALQLAHPEYVVDWGLLRTLQNIQHLTIAKGAGMELLANIMAVASSLRHLQVLEVQNWELTAREYRAWQPTSLSQDSYGFFPYSEPLLPSEHPSEPLHAWASRITIGRLQALKSLVISACPRPVVSVLLGCLDCYEAAEDSRGGDAGLLEPERVSGPGCTEHLDADLASRSMDPSGTGSKVHFDVTGSCRNGPVKIRPGSGPRFGSECVGDLCRSAMQGCNGSAEALPAPSTEAWPAGPHNGFQYYPCQAHLSTADLGAPNSSLIPCDASSSPRGARDLPFEASSRTVPSPYRLWGGMEATASASGAESYSSLVSDLRFQCMDWLDGQELLKLLKLPGDPEVVPDSFARRHDSSGGVGWATGCVDSVPTVGHPATGAGVDVRLLSRLSIRSCPNVDEASVALLSRLYPGLEVEVAPCLHV